jgi:hypothetical protein
VRGRCVGLAIYGHSAAVYGRVDLVDCPVVVDELVGGETSRGCEDVLSVVYANKSKKKIQIHISPSFFSFSSFFLFSPPSLSPLSYLYRSSISPSLFSYLSFLPPSINTKKKKGYEARGFMTVPFVGCHVSVGLDLLHHNGCLFACHIKPDTYASSTTYHVVVSFVIIK